MVVFQDGKRERIDTILWATGYRTTFPFLEDGHLDWAEGVPLRVGGGAIAARTPGLYFNGLASPRGGNLPMHSACAELIAECIAAQRDLPGGLVGEPRKPARPVPLDGSVAGAAGVLEELNRHCVPAPVMDGSVAEIIRDARTMQRRVAGLRRRAKKG